MTEGVFETGARLLELGRRLLATPSLAEMPAAYESLLRDPGELLEETWGSVAHGETVREESAARSAARAERVAGGAQVSPSKSAAFAPNALDFTSRPARPSAAVSPGPTQTPNAGPKAVPLRLTENRRSAYAPATKDESSFPSPSRQGTAPGTLPLELASDGRATEESAEAYDPAPLYGEKARRFVEWPAARPAAGAALAAPGNVRQETAEESEADPELQVLRGQLGVDEEKRERLQTGRARASFREGGTEARGTEARRVEDNSADFPGALTPTSFSPLTSLLSKNVSRAETPRAPLVPEVLNGGGGSLWSTPDGEKRAVAERASEERTSRDETRTGGNEAARRSSAPTVDEVLEELHERLRLEFSRTYGTTGG